MIFNIVILIIVIFTTGIDVIVIEIKCIFLKTIVLLVIPFCEDINKTSQSSILHNVYSRRPVFISKQFQLFHRRKKKMLAVACCGLDIPGKGGGGGGGGGRKKEEYEALPEHSSLEKLPHSRNCSHPKKQISDKWPDDSRRFVGLGCLERDLLYQILKPF